MQISENITKMINGQIKAEFESAYLYQDIANYYYEKGLHGFASWFQVQAKEEVEHAEKFIAYLHQEGKNVVLGDIKKLGKDYASLEEPLQIQIDHEALVTSLIHAIYAAARKEDDFRTESFLVWFVDEQAEEEEHSRNLLQEFKFAEKADALIDVDRALAERK